MVKKKLTQLQIISSTICLKKSTLPRKLLELARTRHARGALEFRTHLWGMGSTGMSQGVMLLTDMRDKALGGAYISRMLPFIFASRAETTSLFRA